MELPRTLGFYLPAEFERHEATWLSWPKNEGTFPKKILGRVEKTYCQMVGALQGGEKVNVLVDNESHKEAVQQKLEANGVGGKNIFLHEIASADVWMRDYSPIFVKNSEGVAATKWVYNALGNKYDDLLADNETGERIIEALSMQSFHPGIVLEGGSIDCNGAGTLLTTTQCLLNKNRNPHLSKKQIEENLKNYLGVNNIVWLGQGVAGDDTDGHIDDFARFISESKIGCAFEEDKSDENYVALKKNFELLQNAKNERGEKFEVIKLPMPQKMSIVEENRRLPASHANFYVANKCVLLPVFGGQSDGEATQILEACFPERKIVPIYANDLVYGYGGIHCVTMQEPKA